MTAVQLGRHPLPTHSVAHLSDTHFLADRVALYGAVDTDARLASVLDRLVERGEKLDAVVITGDIGDRGEADAYDRVVVAVENFAAVVDCEIVWVVGNHDERARFRERVLREERNDEPIDSVSVVGGLRIVSLDSSVPGYHHGDLSPEQLAWLSSVLDEPAEHGTLLAMHHPPIPTPLGAMTVLELRNQEALAETLAGSDVRGILAGHLHYTSSSTFVGIPVHVAAATSYTMDLAASERTMSGVDGGQSFSLVHVYPDTIVSSVVPSVQHPRVASFDESLLDRLEVATPEERIEIFSRMRDRATTE